MNLFDQISDDIKKAMLAKDVVARDTLRNVKKEFIEAKTAKNGADELSDDEAVKIITKLVKKGKDASEIYIQQGRQDLADEELAQVAVMEKYLPKQFTDEELTEKVKAIIEETGATGPKDMGKVMGIASKTLAGKAEGRLISEKVKTLLASM